MFQQQLAVRRFKVLCLKVTKSCIDEHLVNFWIALYFFLDRYVTNRWGFRDCVTFGIKGTGVVGGHEGLSYVLNGLTHENLCGSRVKYVCLKKLYKVSKLPSMRHTLALTLIRVTHPSCLRVISVSGERIVTPGSPTKVT